MRKGRLAYCVLSHMAFATPAIPGAFCAGGGFDIVDVLYLDASEPEGVFAFANSFGSYADSYGLRWQADVGTPESAAKLAAAAGVEWTPLTCTWFCMRSQPSRTQEARMLSVQPHRASTLSGL